MWAVKGFVPETIKNRLHLVIAKVRHLSCSVSSLVRGSVMFGRGCYVVRGARVSNGVQLGDFSCVNRVSTSAMLYTPDKLIRFRLPADVVAELLETRWWERSTDELAADAGRFQTPWQGTACGEVAR